MYKLIKFTIALFLFISCQNETQENTTAPPIEDNSPKEIPELEFLEIRQLGNSYNDRFDLSGICFDAEGNIWTIADKSHNNAIYQIAWANDKNTWEVVQTIDLSIPSNTKTDFEALDFADSIFYISNEYDQSIFTYNLHTQKLENILPPYAEAGINPQDWKSNTGLEGLAIDATNQIAYLGKERDPRMIYTFDRSLNTISDSYDFPQTHSNDIGDMKVQNGFLYVLERNGNYITKIDLESKKVVDKVSYRDVCSAPEGKLYDAKFGMAEALLLSENEIWLGLDNNQDEVTPYAEEKYNLKGNKSAIIRFKRPTNF